MKMKLVNIYEKQEEQKIIEKY